MHTFTCLVITAVFLAAPFSTHGARTKVYRCVLDDGHISYQQIACHGEAKPIAIKDKRSGWSPLRPGERALLDSYRTKDAARYRKPSAKKKKPAKETRSCWNKRKQLDAVSQKFRHGYKLTEGNKLRQKRETYEEYLREFCS